MKNKKFMRLLTALLSLTLILTVFSGSKKEEEQPTTTLPAIEQYLVYNMA